MQITNKPTTYFGYLTPNEMPPKLRTVSGAPPLTVTGAKAALPRSITIYGNTVDDVGVGDKIKNLFSSAKYVVPLALDEKTYKFACSNTNSDNRTRTYYIPIQPNTTYIYSNTYGKNLFIGSCPEIPKLGGELSNIVKLDAAENISQFCSITTSENDRYLALYPLYISELESGMTYDKVEQYIVITDGVPIDTYINCGYTIPIQIEHSSEAGAIEVCEVYIDEPLASSSDKIIINPNTRSVRRVSGNNIFNLSEYNPLDFPPLEEGTNVIGIDTATPPSEVAVTCKI